MMSSVQVSTRAEQGSSQDSVMREQAALPVRAVSNLTAPEKATIVIISGVLGSGKTSLIEGIVAGVSLPKSEVAAVFNERYSSLAQTDAARVSRIESATVGGCSCCTSRDQVVDSVSRFLSSGRKLILVEQSGASDGAELLRVMRKEMGHAGQVQVRLIALVDTEHVRDIPPSVLYPPIIAADCVIQTHVPVIRPGGNSSNATQLVESLRGRPPDLQQVRAGEIPNETWERLLAAPAGERPAHSSRPHPSALSSGVGTDSGSVERLRFRDSLCVTPLVVFAQTTTESIKTALANSRIPIARAKGWIPRTDGKVIEVQFERKDDGQGVISFGAPLSLGTPPAPPVAATPIFNLMSYEGTPRVEDFLSVGLPDFSGPTVRYYLGLYPSEVKIQSSVRSPEGTPIRSDGDALPLAAFGLVPHLQQLPPVAKAEKAFVDFQTAFLPLLFGYTGFRIASAHAIRSEQAAPQAEYAARCVALGHALSWVSLRFGKFLGQGERPLLQRVLDIKPTQLLFSGLEQLREPSLAGRPLLTTEVLRDLVPMAAFGVQYQGLTRASLVSHLRAFEKNCGSQLPQPQRDELAISLNKILNDQDYK